ncbi:MAG: DUF4339 domain-containing protein [Verrucomicrobia bacterium]|nr:DUF4339 domain-containing protein [Verrucomicrobiota bacterium]
MEIFIKNGEKKDGPYSKEELQGLLNDGKLKKTTLVIHDGLSNWIPLAAVLTTRTVPPPHRSKSEMSPAGGTSPIPPVPQVKTTEIPANPISVSGQNTLRVSPPPVPEQPGGNKPQQGAAQVTTSFEVDQAVQFLTSEFQQGVEQMRAVRWDAIFPLKEAVNRTSWNVGWVKLLLVLSVIPVLLQFLMAGRTISAEQGSFGVALYVEFFWAFCLWLLLRPGKIEVGLLRVFVLVPLVVGLACLTLAGKVGFIAAICEVTGSDSFFKRLGGCLVVSSLSQIIISLPILLLMRRQDFRISTPAVIFCGCIAGLTLGMTTGLRAFLGEKWPLFATSADLGQLGFVGLTRMLRQGFASMILGGLLYLFVSMGRQQSHLSRGYTLYGILATAVLSVVFHASYGSVLGPLIALVMSGLFVVHISKTLRA